MKKKKKRKNGEQKLAKKYTKTNKIKKNVLKITKNLNVVIKKKA